MPKKIEKGSSPPTGRIPVPRPISPQHLKFSFKFLDYSSNQKFCFDHCKQGYPRALLTKLKELSRFTWTELTQGQFPALRIHPIDFAETTEPDGFVGLNEQLKGERPWQFSLTANEHGRVHGFVLDEQVFYPYWIDPAHKLYDKR
jgi:hypothetical protein